MNMDGGNVELYTTGLCHVLALALNAVLPESELVALVDEAGAGTSNPSNPDDGIYGMVVHVFVELPSGAYLDIRGPQTKNEIIDQFPDTREPVLVHGLSRETLDGWVEDTQLYAVKDPDLSVAMQDARHLLDRYHDALMDLCGEMWPEGHVLVQGEVAPAATHPRIKYP